MSTVAPLKGDSGRFSFGLSATSTATTVATASPQPALSAGLDKTPVAPTFGLPSLASPSEPAKTTHPTSTAAGATAAAVTTTTPKFGFAEKVKSGVPAVSSAPNFNLFATLSTTTAPVSLPKPTFSLGTQAPKEAIITTTTSVAAPASVQSVTMPSFSFKFPTSGHATKPSPTQSVSVFGGPAVFGAKPVVALDKKQTSGSPAEKPKTSSTFGGSPGMALFGTSSSVFGGGLSGGGSGGFAALAAMAKAEPAKEKKETVSTSSTTITPFGGMAFNNVGTSVFSSPASEKKEEGKTKSSEKASPKGNHSEGEEEFVPTAHFEPVIPTPPLIQVKTGEENEKHGHTLTSPLFRT
ncbi:hypothetical protein Tcan_18832 [Toxocara canis]|uniref:RanBD1 domain-containing protein n=1 Tax=Toxocara canis TaxID=6265 RepID=A0A0B2VDC0_TOXCA|nr:hypothetical protein Tcan_18832 [Toxocara canis]